MVLDQFNGEVSRRGLMKKAPVRAVGLGFGGTNQLLTAGGNEVEITVVNNENGPDLTKRVDAD